MNSTIEPIKYRFETLVRDEIVAAVAGKTIVDTHISN